MIHSGLCVNARSVVPWFLCVLCFYVYAVILAELPETNLMRMMMMMLMMMMMMIIMNIMWNLCMFLAEGRLLQIHRRLPEILSDMDWRPTEPDNPSRPARWRSWRTSSGGPRYPLLRLSQEEKKTAAGAETPKRIRRYFYKVLTFVFEIITVSWRLKYWICLICLIVLNYWLLMLCHCSDVRLSHLY